MFCREWWMRVRDRMMALYGGWLLGIGEMCLFSVGGDLLSVGRDLFSLEDGLLSDRSSLFSFGGFTLVRMGFTLG